MTTALEGGEESASRSSCSLPPGKTRYPLYRRLAGPRAGLDRCGKSRHPPGFDSRAIQPVASRYTDYATRPTTLDTSIEIFWHVEYVFDPYQTARCAGNSRKIEAVPITVFLERKEKKKSWKLLRCFSWGGMTKLWIIFWFSLFAFRLGSWNLITAKSERVLFLWGYEWLSNYRMYCSKLVTCVILKNIHILVITLTWDHISHARPFEPWTYSLKFTEWHQQDIPGQLLLVGINSPGVYAQISVVDLLIKLITNIYNSILGI